MLTIDVKILINFLISIKYKYSFFELEFTLNEEKEDSIFYPPYISFLP